MKLKKKKRWTLLWSMMYILLMGMTAYAHEIPDVNRECSLAFTMRYGTEMVNGGSLTLYRVGEVVEDDGNYDFEPTDEFASSGETFDDLEDQELAVRLEKFVKEKSISSSEIRKVNEEGQAIFEKLSVGLYLVVQDIAAPGYEKIAPFLIALPHYEDGVYIYDREAVPKTELEKEPIVPDTPPDIPQTGQLWWPVPLLVCGGLVMIVIGFGLNRRKKLDEDKTN